MNGQTAERLASRDDPARAVGLRIDLESAIAQLTDDQRELVTLKFIQGLSNTEIGAVTGRKPEAIRVLQFRALSALRRFYGSQGVDDER